MNREIIRLFIIIMLSSFIISFSAIWDIIDPPKYEVVFIIEDIDIAAVQNKIDSIQFFANAFWFASGSVEKRLHYLESPVVQLVLRHLTFDKIQLADESYHKDGSLTTLQSRLKSMAALGINMWRYKSPEKGQKKEIYVENVLGIYTHDSLSKRQRLHVQEWLIRNQAN